MGRMAKRCACALAAALALAGILGGCRPKGEATLADYWAGKAEFISYYEEPAGTGAADYHGICGISMAVLDDTWYRFNRYLVDDDGTVRFGINCRKSTDRGQTWSEPVKVVEPEKGSPWALYATDGHAIYDEREDKWRMIFQAKSASSPWNLAYLEREGRDPMGAFTAPEGFTNPCVLSGDIWTRIADDENDDCVKITVLKRKIFEEGTPAIVQEENGTFYVTFHGAAPVGRSSIHGFRGIATTKDFQTFEPAAEDAIFDEYDAQDWNVDWLDGGPVGGGHATYLKEGDYWYTIIECPDGSLSGQAKQHWPFGLLRSKELTSTKWENYANNPLPEFPTSGYVCEWQYARLFKDGGTTYLAVSKMLPEEERGFRIYRLAWK